MVKKIKAKKQRMKATKIFILFFFLLILFTFFQTGAAAQQMPSICKDVSVSITIPDIINESSGYTKFARITNNDDIPAVNDNLSLVALFNITNLMNSNVIYWNTSKIINSYTESGLGTINLANGSYLFCASIMAINFEDYDSSNDFACKFIYVGDNSTAPEEAPINSTNNLTGNFTDGYEYNLTENETLNGTANETFNATINSTINLTVNVSVNVSANASGNISINETISNETINETPNATIPENSTFNSTTNYTEMNFNCSCKLKIETNKIIFLDGERIEIGIIGCENTSKFSTPVEYWVEDRQKIVKPKLSTLTKTVKYYTPSVDQPEKYFVVKAKYDVCEEISEQLVIFVSGEENKTTGFTIDADSEEDGDILYVKLEGYKAGTDKTLISLWVEKDNDKFSETTKVYINRKNSEFDFELPLLLDAESTGDYFIVAEGLDFKVKKEVRIVRTESDTEAKATSTKSTSTASATRTANLDELGKINSFYTMKKIFDENITVYVNIENPAGKTLMISCDENKYAFFNLSVKNSFNISISSEQETLLAELFQSGELVDSKELRLNLSPKKENLGSNDENKTENNTNSVSAGSTKKTDADIKSKIASMTFYSSINESRLYESQINNSSVERGNRLTGQVVESPASVNFRKEHIYFVIPAMAVGLLLFSRKTRLFLIKKIMYFVRLATQLKRNIKPSPRGNQKR